MGVKLDGGGVEVDVFDECLERQPIEAQAAKRKAAVVKADKPRGKRRKA